MNEPLDFKSSLSNGITLMPRWFEFFWTNNLSGFDWEYSNNYVLQKYYQCHEKIIKILMLRTLMLFIITFEVSPGIFQAGGI